MVGIDVLKDWKAKRTERKRAEYEEKQSVIQKDVFEAVYTVYQTTRVSVFGTEKGELTQIDRYMLDKMFGLAIFTVSMNIGEKLSVIDKELAKRTKLAAVLAIGSGAVLGASLATFIANSDNTLAAILSGISATTFVIGNCWAKKLSLSGTVLNDSVAFVGEMFNYLEQKQISTIEQFIMNPDDMSDSMPQFIADGVLDNMEERYKTENQQLFNGKNVNNTYADDKYSFIYA